MTCRYALASPFCGVVVLPLYCMIFDIQIEPDKLDKTKEVNFAGRANHLMDLSQHYFEELGNNAYALFNVMTDYASFPEHESETSLRVNNYQRKVGAWVDEFLKARESKDFSLSNYIGQTAQDTAAYMEKLAKKYERPIRMFY